MNETPINQNLMQLTSTVPTDGPKTVLKPASGQEIQFIENIKNNINIEDTTSIIKYGTEAQTAIANFTDGVLQHVKTKDVGETGKHLEAMIDEMNSISFDSIKASDGFMANLPIIGYWVKKGVKKITGDFSTVQSKVVELMTTMSGQETILAKDIKMFDDFYNQTLDFVRNLELFIMAGELKVVDLKKEVEELKVIAEQTQDHLDAQKWSDKFKAVDRFERRLHNLKISRIASINSGSHIRMAQEADKMLIEDINDIINSTIPLWKNQFVMAISLLNSEKALKINKTVKDYTNKQYVDNANKLNGLVSQLGEEYQRGILDIDSLEQVNKLTIDTIQKSLSIHKNASVKRGEAEKRLTLMEDELKDALTDASAKGGL